jgi:hypothetical protein
VAFADAFATGGLAIGARPAQTCRRSNRGPPQLDHGTMFKWIGLILAALPVYFLLKSLVMGTKTGSQAVANFKQQVDYAVWVILFFIGCAVVYGIAKLVFNIH